MSVASATVDSSEALARAGPSVEQNQTYDLVEENTRSLFEDLPTGYTQEWSEPEPEAEAGGTERKPEGRLATWFTEVLDDEVVDDVRRIADYYEGWQAEKTEAAVGSIEDTTGLHLNQGAQGIVGVAMGIMATLMIGVVVLGKIDGFGTDLSGGWNETSNSVSTQSQDTFDFLNLVPFLLVALFVLGIMASRM
ncbi:hypothetical protein [Haloarchaeobius sp. DFWS5]|uniref:hypothetical protein n=1 Tax=Haloarchaeobius sp. DFWS5 TaxID=3446114 RepID=UPI003EBDC0EC